MNVLHLHALATFACVFPFMPWIVIILLFQPLIMSKLTWCSDSLPSRKSRREFLAFWWQPLTSSTGLPCSFTPLRPQHIFLFLIMK
ncbi:hypothetical protein BDV98DRAFT_134139 [Pterulicium gracile]|uniref:Uncharacterized protein n=1 Tax=Pterulicium gracile TaxID=1884261 RepID=A0A5C3QEU0_9AGAR|nr:hypothetical protein BDV98DRAFT_134139 [Pterula gracilis]